jgi:2-dehydro-3-deoxyphosphogluconate aldolase / (4S)-4-hydroxy-2-oxoglutarate aldolase
MTKEEVLRRIVDIGIASGGVLIVEITMTVPGALDVISELVRSMGKELVVGAGTVLDVDSAKRCIDAGAEFLVSPGLDVEVVKLANKQGMLMMAGALTPTEVIMAWKAGADFVKVFPCGNVGGPKYIKALKGPLPQVPMVPTGGVNLQTAAEFIKAGASALGIGSELVSASALASGNVGEITAGAKQYVAIVREAREVNTATGAIR